MSRIVLVEVTLLKTGLRLPQFLVQNHVILEDPIVLLLPHEVVQASSLDRLRVSLQFDFSSGSGSGSGGRLLEVDLVLGCRGHILRWSKVDSLDLFDQLMVLLVYNHAASFKIKVVILFPMISERL